MPIQLELSSEERAVLESLVREAISDIKSEVRHTMTSGYKDDLRAREQILLDLQNRLAEAP